MRSERRHRLARIALAAASLATAFAAAEIVYRLLARRTSAYSVAPTGDQYHFYEHDPRLGWRNTPGARGTFQREEFAYEVAINRHGMRQGDVALARTPGVGRIAVVGDSFVWGIGVADEQRVTERLAARLADTEVLNFGVSGYSPVQYLLDIDRVLAFSPELVVLVFCLGNDFVDNVQFVRYGYFKAYADIDGAGRLLVLGLPVPNTRAFGFQSQPRWCGSDLLGALVDALGARPVAVEQRGLAGLREADMYASALDGERAEQRQRAVAVNAALLATIAGRVAASGARLLVVPAPTKFEYHPDGGKGHQGVFDVVERLLAANCAQHGLEFVPTVHALRGDDFWEHDGHWTPGGHDKLAAAIASHLVTRGFARAR